MTSLFDLSGQKALVTGGSGVLGRALAEALLEAGATVAVAGTSERTRTVAAEIGALPLLADLSRRDERPRLYDEAVAALGTLDILVLCHGLTRRHKAEDFPLTDWDTTLNVNLTSVFELCQLAGQDMLARGRGKIIIIASVLSFSGGLMVPAYAASKGGVAQLTKALANEWAGRGVNVNAITPGYFDTPLAAGVRNDPVRYQQVLDRLPAGRWGLPEDLKGALVFLASHASDYVHGILLPVDGGWLAR